MRRLYVAAPWADQASGRAVRAALTTAGFVVQARWLDLNQQASHDLADQARVDWDDLCGAEGLVVVNTRLSEGKAVETGIALARGIPVVVIGARTNVFHHLPTLRVVPTVWEAIGVLRQWGEDESPCRPPTSP